MFEETKEIIDILVEKLNKGDGFNNFMSKNTGNDKYANFISNYKEFMKYMSFQYDLCQISSSTDVFNLFSSIQTKLNENSEDYFQFVLRSINEIANVRCMKYELFLKLLFYIVENVDKQNEHIQDLLLENITNRYFLCKLYENDYFPFKKLIKYIQQQDLLFYLVYFNDKVTEEEYNDWCQSLNETMGIEFLEICSKMRKLNENQIDILKTKRENPNLISIYIRTDDLNNFIDITSNNMIDFDSKIPNSINETNSIFLKKIPSTLINYSAFYGATKIFRYLLSNGARFGSNTLVCACAGGNVEIVRLLIQNNIAFNQKCLNKSIKYFAEIPLINFLLENTDLKIGSNEMRKAIKSFNLIFFTFYLSENGNENENDFFSKILHHAVYSNNCQITQFLCELLNSYFDKELINKKDPYKRSPLVKAVRGGYFQITKILIKYGANYNDIDDKIF